MPAGSIPSAKRALAGRHDGDGAGVRPRCAAKTKGHHQGMSPQSHATTRVMPPHKHRKHKCRPPSLFAPTGRRNVATGAAQPASSRAQRNPWKRSPPLSSAPAGQRTCLRLHTFTRSCRLLRPCRGGSKIDLPSTGSASAGCAPPPLHPRLHPDAPPGRSEPITTRLSRLQSP